jgi:hypothetical protein
VSASRKRERRKRRRRRRRRRKRRRRRRRRREGVEREWLRKGFWFYQDFVNEYERERSQQQA